MSQTDYILERMSQEDSNGCSCGLREAVADVLFWRVAKPWTQKEIEALAIALEESK